MATFKVIGRGQNGKYMDDYAREDVIGERFQARNTDAMDAHYDADYYGAIMGPTVNFINNLSISLIRPPLFWHNHYDGDCPRG